MVGGPKPLLELVVVPAPKGEAEDLEKALKPELEKADVEVVLGFSSPVVAASSEVLLDAKAPNGETAEVFAKPLLGGI